MNSELLKALTRIAEALEAQTEATREQTAATLMLLDELTADPDATDQEQGGEQYLSGKPS